MSGDEFDQIRAMSLESATAIFEEEIPEPGWVGAVEFHKTQQQIARAKTNEIRTLKQLSQQYRDPDWHRTLRDFVERYWEQEMANCERIFKQSIPTEPDSPQYNKRCRFQMNSKREALHLVQTMAALRDGLITDVKANREGADRLKAELESIRAELAQTGAEGVKVVGTNDPKLKYREPNPEIAQASRAAASEPRWSTQKGKARRVIDKYRRGGDDA